MSCPIQTLMEEIKPVVTEKYDLEYRDKSIIIMTPFNFRTMKTLMVASQSKLLLSNAL